MSSSKRGAIFKISLNINAPFWTFNQCCGVLFLEAPVCSITKHNLRKFTFINNYLKKCISLCKRNINTENHDTKAKFWTWKRQISQFFHALNLELFSSRGKQLSPLLLPAHSDGDRPIRVETLHGDNKFFLEEEYMIEVDGEKRKHAIN